MGSTATSEGTIDSISQFWITVVLTILAIVIPVVVGVIVYLKQRSRKLVSFKILTATPLLSVGSELKGKLKITYESKEVEDVTLVLVEITNSGNKEILEKDYIEPITIFFGEKSQILLTEVVGVKPSYFKISANSDGKIITLSKTMLNAGDTITLKVLVTGISYILVNGRIAGVKKIEESIPKLSSPEFMGKLAVVIVIIGFAGLIISSILKQTVLGAFFLLVLLIVYIPVGIYAIVKFFEFVYQKLRHK